MFNIDREHNIYLISGENGFGKTTFLYSLLWCLYGRLAIDVEESIRKEVQNGGYSSLLKNNLNYSQKLRVENLSWEIIQSIIQVSQVNRKPSSWDIKGAQGFPHIAENE